MLHLLVLMFVIFVIPHVLHVMVLVIQHVHLAFNFCIITNAITLAMTYQSLLIKIKINVSHVIHLVLLVPDQLQMNVKHVQLPNIYTIILAILPVKM
jgi:hypothetical protein